MRGERAPALKPSALNMRHPEVAQRRVDDIECQFGLGDPVRSSQFAACSSQLAACLPKLPTRAVQSDYIASLKAAREAWIRGGSGLAALTAFVETSVSLWQGSMNHADVRGTDLLDGRNMAIFACALALWGECLFLIRDRLSFPLPIATFEPAMGCRAPIRGAARNWRRSL